MTKGGTRLADAFEIRTAVETDLHEMLEIYNRAIETNTSTFDVDPFTLEQRKSWFEEHSGRYPLVVVESQREVVAFAYLSEFRSRPAYRSTAESSVYVHEERRGMGFGTAAMREIMTRGRALGYHSIVAGIVPPNEPSVRLHRRLGFVKVGTFREVGFKFGSWQDVEFYQAILSGRESSQVSPPLQGLLEVPGASRVEPGPGRP